MSETFAWTDERVTQLRRLWEEGCSASQIASRLGCWSRNAIIGKVHRLKLPARRLSKRPQNHGELTKLPRRRKRQLRPRIKPVATHQLSRPAAPVVFEERPETGAPKPLMLSLLDLTEATCKWPIGHPREAGFGFCGHPKDFADTYCGYHARLAYNDPVRVVRSLKQAEEMA